MNKRNPTNASQLPLVIGASIFVLAVTACTTSQGYPTYSSTGEGGCSDCHGDFRGPTSTKVPPTVFPMDANHEMHRDADSMGTDCNLCHTGDENTRTPVFINSSNGTLNNQGLGCTGCHVASGLREHHYVNGITICFTGCHDHETPPPENVSPPYYGTPDTKVRNPGNTVLAANTNENWSIGDFLGLDNDGNNLYDLADFAIGPYRILSATKEGNNVRVTWLTAGGRRDAVQASGVAAGPYTNVSPALAIPGVGLVTTNYLELNGALNSTRFYRLHYVP